MKRPTQNLKRVNTLILIGLLVSCTTPYENVFDFGINKQGEDWRVIDDGVMGGESKGKVEFSDSSMIFYGKVSLENNGGFTSVKSRYQDYNFREAKTVTVRYRLWGHRASLYMENRNGFRSPYVKHILEESREWKIVKLDLGEFKEYYFGKETGNQLSGTFLNEVKYMGFITSDKKPGKFELEVDYIRFH